MAQHQVWIKTANNWKIKTVEDVSSWQGVEGVLIDPEWPAGTPPHFCKPVNGKLVPMTPKEQAQVLGHHAEHGVINDPNIQPKPRLLWHQRVGAYIKNLFRRRPGDL
jgi:hypothetical protein